MPVVADSSFPDFHNLAAEGLICTPDSDAARRDVPLHMAVFNPMPNKARTAADIARLLGASGHPVHLTFIRPTLLEACEQEFIEKLHQKPSAEAAAWHRHFSQYETRASVAGQRFHGTILAGAPLGQRKIDSLTYWSEWQEFYDEAPHRAGRTLAICLAGMGAAKHLHGIEKDVMPHKMYGVYAQQVTAPHDPLVQGLGNSFNCPVSRFSRLPDEALRRAPVQVLAHNAETGAGLMRLSRDIIALTTHPEYTHDTLHAEYQNALKQHAANPAGQAPRPPVNYYHNEKPQNGIRPNGWKQGASVFGINLVREIRQAAIEKGLLHVPDLQTPIPAARPVMRRAGNYGLT